MNKKLVICETCGKNFYRYQSQLTDYKHHYCSIHCKQVKHMKCSYQDCDNQSVIRYQNQVFCNKHYCTTKYSSDSKFRNNMRDYRQNPKNKERRKMIDRQHRSDLIKLLGEICKNCGCNDYHSLQLDHINHDGRQDRIRFGLDSRKMIIYYLNHLEEAKQKLQIL